MTINTSNYYTYHHPKSRPRKRVKPTNISMPLWEKCPVLHMSSDSILGLWWFSHRMISSNEPPGARRWQKALECSIIYQLKCCWIHVIGKKLPIERCVICSIDCKVTNNVASSIWVWSRTRRLIFLRRPKCQNAVDSIWRHPLKLSSIVFYKFKHRCNKTVDKYTKNTQYLVTRNT